MGTRSTIALEYADGTVEQVYCHWDGYIDHNGVILYKHYSNPFKLAKLISLGDMSSLGMDIGEQHPFSPPYNEQDPEVRARVQAAYDHARTSGWTTFYARDRGETDVSARRFASFDKYVTDHQYEEYEYILRQVDGKPVWFVCNNSDTRGFVRLEVFINAITAAEMN